jgi:hypothetical protein
VTRRAVVALCLALAAAGCGGGRSSPREVLDALRAAVATEDAAALDALVDSESVAHRRDEIRVRRAMLARGDDPAEATAGLPLTAEEIQRGTVDEAAVLLLKKRTPMFSQGPWIRSAVVAEEVAESEDVTLLRLRGADGVERSFWFLKERGRWCFDLFRTRRAW